MNDFTKKELEAIYCHMENEPLDLMNKIKSMIESYCEHELSIKINITEQGSPFVVRCCKCGRNLHDNE